MKVRVEFYSQLRDLAGTAELNVDLPADATVTDLLEKMNISSKVISDEDKEDMGLLMMMKEVDRSEKVSYEEVMKKLNS